MSKDEWKLVEEAKQGDAHAFARLYERYYEDLYRFAFAIQGMPRRQKTRSARRCSRRMKICRNCGKTTHLKIGCSRLRQMNAAKF